MVMATHLKISKGAPPESVTAITSQAHALTRSHADLHITSKSVEQNDNSKHLACKLLTQFTKLDPIATMALIGPG